MSATTLVLLFLLTNSTNFLLSPRMLCLRRQQPIRDDHAVRVHWFSSADALFLVIRHLGQDDKITLILHFQSHEIAISAIICMYADMSQPSQRVFSPLTLSILKTIINLQKFSVKSCHHIHKGSHTGELHCLFLQP